MRTIAILVLLFIFMTVSVTVIAQRLWPNMIPRDGLSGSGGGQPTLSVLTNDAATLNLTNDAGTLTLTQ